MYATNGLDALLDLFIKDIDRIHCDCCAIILNNDTGKVPDLLRAMESLKGKMHRAENFVKVIDSSHAIISGYGRTDKGTVGP